jgi:hypothetical protein
MLLVFAFTLFLSATLLFLVQPLVGKLILPYLGGTPAVWNTCMVFFQALLLAGYAYAHALTRWLRPRSQLVVHALLLLAPLLPLTLLRFDVGRIAQAFPPPGEANPIPWLLTVLLLAVGLPFFVVSTSAPLLQTWFAGTDHPAARDPYFLYAASNVGSMLALLCYPSLIEPYLRLPDQGVLWGLAYAGLALLIYLCGLLALRGSGHQTDRAASPAAEQPPDVSAAPTLLRRLRWILLAFVPSSLMLGVTTYITTDIAAIPLLWILPLALYLLSFILVFSRIPYLARVLHGIMILLLPVVTLALAFEWVVVQEYKLTNFEKILLHLSALFIAAMVCHGELARTRPATAYLTEFYLWMSLGGVLGGLFNALLAPNLFNRVWEYPLIIALACVLMPRWGFKAPAWLGLRLVDWGLACCLAVFGVVLGGLFLLKAFVSYETATEYVSHLPPAFQEQAQKLVTTLCDSESDLIYRERNFFGYFAVVRIPYVTREGVHERYHKMYHGTTTHGMQCVEPASRRSEPLTYFHRTGPIGELFETIDARNKPQRVAVLGVGTGTLAAYMRPGWELTLYEIDAAVVRMARDTEYFTYIPDAEARGVHLNVILGDGRLQFQKAPDASYDLIFMDAFTSDAVPVHLITREAVEMYLAKLKPDGLLVINIANRYLTFSTILGNLAQTLGLEGWIQAGDEDRSIDRYATAWVVMGRSKKALGQLLNYERDGVMAWSQLPADPRLGVWTDDYSNLLAVFRWKR